VQLGEKAEGKKISKQTWGILRKIKEVDAFLSADLSRQSWIKEVHPEVSFAQWNSGKPILDNKIPASGSISGKGLAQLFITHHFFIAERMNARISGLLNLV
jgi:predicted RNase H-like nuclease